MQGWPWLDLGWETCPTFRQPEGPWVRILQGFNVGPTVCPQFRTSCTCTLGGVDKKGLPAEFAHSRPDPEVLPPKVVPHKNVHVVPVSDATMLVKTTGL